MSLNSKTIIDKLVSKAQGSGLFDAVNGHEPKNAPGGTLTAAVWLDRISPAASDSGLARTSAVVVAMLRLYTNMVQEPQDAIDPALAAATDTLLAAISSDFTLAGTVRNVDLLGQTGTALGARAGYVTIGQTMFRVIDITVPCIVSDVWPQEAT